MQVAGAGEPQCTCGDWRTTLESWFSPSILRQASSYHTMKSQLAGFWESLASASHLTIGCWDLGPGDQTRAIRIAQQVFLSTESIVRVFPRTTPFGERDGVNGAGQQCEGAHGTRRHQRGLWRCHGGTATRRPPSDMGV